MRRALDVVLAVIRPLALAFVLLAAFSAHADFESGQRALETGKLDEAVAAWRRAADEGDARAMLALGRLHREGRGVLQDYVEAHKWFNLAASRGVAEAVEERNALSAKMTPAQMAAAQERAAAWRSGDTPPDVTTARPQAPARDAGPPPREAIEEAQSLLARLGYKPGPADGFWGHRTGAAYRAFLRDTGQPMMDALTPRALLAMRDIAGSRGGGAAAPSRRALPEDALHRAVQAGDLKSVEAALAAGADANGRDGRGWTALMHAVNKGYPLLVEPLLAAGAGVDVRAPDGATALFMAAVLGHTEIVALLMKAGADHTLRGPQGKTAVDVARLTFGTLEIARANGLDVAVVGLVEGKTWSELKEEMRMRELEEEQFFALLGRAPSARRVDAYGWTDLHWAAVLNFPILANALLEKGVSVDAKLIGNNRKIQGEFKEYFSTAIGYGGGNKVWTTARYQEPLHFAALLGALEVAKVLIEHGADVDIKTKWHHYAPLHIAIRGQSRARHEDELERLQDTGRGKFADIVELLLGHGADVNTRTDAGETPLYFASSDEEIITRILISHGADVNARNINDETPLHEAAFELNVEIARMLIEHGARTNVRNYAGRTPRQNAADAPEWYDDEAKFLKAQDAMFKLLDN